MSHTVRFFALLSVFCMNPIAAWAHPGHSPLESTPVHYVTDPVHSLGVVGIVACLIAIATVVASLRRDAKLPWVRR